VAELPGNFIQVQLVVLQQLFYFLYFLLDDKALDGDALALRKETAQVTVIFVQALGQQLTEIYLQFGQIGMMNQLDNGIAYAFNPLSLIRFVQSEGRRLQASGNGRTLLFCRIWLHLRDPPRERLRLQTCLLELLPEHRDAAIANHVLDMQYHR